MIALGNVISLTVTLLPETRRRTNACFDIPVLALEDTCYELTLKYQTVAKLHGQFQ